MKWNNYFLRHHWLQDEEGEARVFTHAINYSKRDYKGTWPKHGAAWLYFRFPRLEQTLHFSWNIFGRSVGAGIKFDTTDEEDIKFWIGIPFLTTLWFGINHAKWVLRLLRIEWSQVRDKPSRDWSRSLEFRWHSGALWIDPWVSSDEWSSKHRSTFSINPANILLGRQRYSETDRVKYGASIVMPEGEYPLEVELYTARWKRPRWPQVKSRPMADVEVLPKSGIPIPGKGENSWDLDDDAIFGMSCRASTVEEAIASLRRDVERTRDNYGWGGDSIRND